MTSSERASEAALRGVSDRYELTELLGQGGMARVYRAVDRTRGIEVALKQLSVDPANAQRKSTVALFEREFQTLAQLRHPNVIAVYDYGLPVDAGPYYTMELLDGGDLLDRVPMPWQQACGLMFDVCSSLALLHSRRLLHRDISPRNIRCTRAGSAKLIDFGAMGPMTAGGAQVVGTPAFSAPETLHRLALDARTDLYSVGATLYFALTGRLPYPGRTFADMLVAWGTKVVPPSVLAPDVPPALDDLVLALVNPEPELRPPSAYEVMQRLAALAGLQAAESETVSRAYLATPSLVGREAALDQLRKQLLSARLTRSTGSLIRGPSGIGRSRLLDACALEAKTLGFYVLRTAAAGVGEVFGVAQALISHLLETCPQLATAPEAASLWEATGPDAGAAKPAWRKLSDPSLDPSQVQRALCQLLIGASRSQPLLLAIDDIHRIDPPSAALLAALLDARRSRLFVALTSDEAAPESDATAALSRRCELLTPPPLTREQTRSLLGSLFGEVTHLSMLTDEIHRLAAGNPRRCIDLAQHLVDSGVVRYESGSWLLPPRLALEDLPRDAAAALQSRLSRLSPLARWLAEAQALAYFDTFSDQDYHALLPDESSASIEQALSELLAQQVIVRDGERYGLSNRVWSAALRDGLDTEEQRARHRALVALYEGTSSTAQVHHAFCAGLDELGLDLLLQRHATYDQLDVKELVAQSVGRMRWTYQPAIAAAVRLGRSPREIHELRRWELASAIAQDWTEHDESARLWFERLARDSGLELYRADTASDPGERLTRALQGAYQRYQATPEAERVYAVDEAIRLLAEYVVYGIALGGRAQDIELLRQLPPILEPFAALSPVLDAIWNNALATCSSVCDAQYASAHRRWTQVLAKLDAMSGDAMQHIEPIRNAVVYALALMRVQMGLGEVGALADRLDHDPYQSVAALTLRKIERLVRGDWRAAEEYRRRAEVLALELRWPQMFRSSLLAEIWTYVRAGDLAGVQQVIEQMRALAAHYPGWLPNLVNAEGYFHVVRGDHAAAKQKFEQCIELAAPGPDGRTASLVMRISSHAGLAEALFGLEQFEASRSVANTGLLLCDANELASYAFELTRVLALAEGKLGLFAPALARIDELIAQQQQLSVEGLRLGLSYETRARLALWSGDNEGFERFASLTAREYRHGARSPLGARYERLLNEAQRRGVYSGAPLPSLISSSIISGDAPATEDFLTVVARSMAGKTRAEQRAETALALLCAAHQADEGHLYLMSGAGLMLRASRGATGPQTQLSDAAGRFLDAELTRSKEMAEMVTGELDEEVGSPTAYTSGDTRYELLLLSCVVDTASAAVGVAAIAANDVRLDNRRQAQLLNALAAHLLADRSGAA